ncbi:MAG TPA: histidinol-phosphate transaminase [Bacillota bacterium]|nr:histidinol-phosphate transaminase [Bacillota bacterium]
MNSFLTPSLAELRPYTPGFQPKGDRKYIKLNTNENPFPPSPRVLEAIAAGAGMLNLYSDPSLSRLKKAIARYESVSEDCVTVSNGSDEVLAFCFHGFCPNGAVFADITYGFYGVFCDMFGVASTVVPLRDDFTLDTDAFAKTKGTLFIANPNAPTGIYCDAERIASLAAADRSRLVIVDEAYIDFGKKSCVEYTKKYDNLLVIQTFSKSRSLAGARIGYAIGCRALIADLEKLRNSFNPYNVNTLSLLAGEAAMDDTEYFEACLRTVIENRAFLTQRLRELGFKIPDSSANFVFARVPDGFDAGAFADALSRQDILVRHFGAERIKDCLRISVGSKDECSALIHACKKLINERKSI